MTPVNTDELESATYVAERRVLEIQAKLHRWARDDPHRRFDDLFNYLRSYAWSQVMKWLRRKHRRINRKDLRRRYCGGGWWPSGEERTLFDPGKVRTTRYRYRGTVIPSPWPTTG